MKETDIVKLSNNYIEKKSDLSFTARKLFIAVAWQIQKLGIKEAGEIELSAKELNKLVGVNLNKPQTFIDAFSELREKTIIVKDKDGTKTNIFGVFNEAEMTDRNVVIEISKSAFPLIQNLTKQFTKLQALDIQKIEHKSSLIIYKLLRQYLNTRSRTRIMKIDELKEILGVKQKYKEFSNFKREILNLAKNELKEKCTIFFDYELIKYGRRYTKIKFIIKERKKGSKDYKSLYETERESKITEIYNSYNDEMLDAYNELYGAEETRLFNYNSDGTPKKMLMKALIKLQFLDFPSFDVWLKGYKT